MADAPHIALDRVGKTYPGAAQPAVCDVSFEIAQGEFVAVVGGSGSGKTTLLKCINRLIEPDAGEVRIGGRPNRSVDGPTLRRAIGYVFQHLGLFLHMTVAENIAAAPKLAGWSRQTIAARVAELLELVALPDDYGSRFPSALSGGQKQRVAVARAIAARPAVVLMDEPFGALDPLTRENLGEAYRALHDRVGATTVMITHDVQEAVLLADRIIVMHAGRLVADGTPGALMAGHPNPAVADLMAAPRRQAERVQALLERGL